MSPAQSQDCRDSVVGFIRKADEALPVQPRGQSHLREKKLRNRCPQTLIFVSADPEAGRLAAEPTRSTCVCTAGPEPQERKTRWVTAGPLYGLALVANAAAANFLLVGVLAAFQSPSCEACFVRAHSLSGNAGARKSQNNALHTC